MLIEIHMIQNHSPANLNRDDLGAPKTCYFGGVLRSRISSQCIKRSIRTSKEFEDLMGGRRTRQLAKLIMEEVGGGSDVKRMAAKILKNCGIKADDDGKSDMLVYISKEAIKEMADLLKNDSGATEDELTLKFGSLITELTAVPDMALSGRMLETGELKDTQVEAALQASHAISTHIARPEVDYYVAKDDIPGEDAGAGYVNEAMYASACFYKYFSIHWEQLVKNLRGDLLLSAHTVGAFLRGAALTNPSGKQNSYAANNHPDGILIEFRNFPVSYANAFANPVNTDARDLIGQSIAQLADYVHDLDVGYGRPDKGRLWFSPNLRYRLARSYNEKIGDNYVKKEMNLIPEGAEFRSLDELVPRVIKGIDSSLDWEAVKQVKINTEAV